MVVGARYSCDRERAGGCRGADSGDLPNRFPLRSRNSADGFVCGTGNGCQPNRRSAARGSVHQETNVDLNASLPPGWARAVCSGPVKASLLYRLHKSEGAPTAEAGVYAAAVPATRFVTFAEQGEGQFGTGVAYANPSATPAFVTFTAKGAAGQMLPASFGHCCPEAMMRTVWSSCLGSPALPDRSKSPPRSPSSVCRSISKPIPYSPPCLRENWMLPRSDLTGQARIRDRKGRNHPESCRAAGHWCMNRCKRAR